MRKHIAELQKEGKSFREIGKILKLSFTTVGYIVKKYLETGRVENKPRPGGPSKLTSRAKRMIVSAGLKARTPKKKPYISEVNKKRLLEFAMKYKNKPNDFWKKVVFSDKSKFDIFISPGENVMVWRCVAHNGAGNLAFIENRMNALAYIDVLRHNLLDSAKKLSMENSFIFQQVNDPKHTAIVTKGRITRIYFKQFSV
ncbi:uncharacterized protein TNCV_4080181 [Trichonephila clavipes]|nr:uncharacterized protein TNCV_4080181 [Trichonephila clavipes]